MPNVVFLISIAFGLITGGPATTPDVPSLRPPTAQTESAPACPLVYAPVTCDHNKTYPNQCEADRHHATNCVPSVGL
jgi:hypothetical protein